MKQIQTIINSLNNDPFYAIRITNADTLKVIGTNLTGEDLIRDYETVEGFFNDLFSSVQNVVIQPRRKNGSSYKDAGEPQKICTAAKETQQTAPITPTLTAIPMPADSMNGLMGGLNAMEMSYRHQHFPKLERENDKLKADNEALKEKIDKMKEEALEARFSESKAEGNKSLISGLMGALPGLISAAASLKNGSPLPTAGLASPEVDNLSITKQNMIQAITDSSDQVTAYMLITLKGINTVPEFAEQLEKLLTENNLIP
jgi:hypothetical protein